VWGKLGNEDDQASVKKKNFDKKNRLTRSSLLVATELTAISCQNQLRFYTNTTLYQIDMNYVGILCSKVNVNYSLDFKYTDYLDLSITKRGCQGCEQNRIDKCFGF
jgi:hypothetical protein